MYHNKWHGSVIRHIFSAFYQESDLSLQINTKQFRCITFILWNIFILMGGTPLPGWQGPMTKWIICYGPHSHRISTQLNTYGRVCTDVSDSALRHHHQNMKWGKIFWKKGVHPSSRVQNQCQGMKLSWQHVLAQHQLTKTLSCFFCFYHLSVNSTNISTKTEQKGKRTVGV